MKAVLFACITLLLIPSVAFSQNLNEEEDVYSSSSGEESASSRKRPRQESASNRSDSAFGEYQARNSSGDEGLALASMRRRRGDGENSTVATYEYIRLTVDGNGEIEAEQVEEVMIDLDAKVTIHRIIERGLSTGRPFSLILVNLGQPVVFSDASDFEDECRERLAHYIIEQNVYGLGDLNNPRHVLGRGSPGLRGVLRTAILEILDDSPIGPRVELGQLGDSFSFRGLGSDCH